MFLYKMLTVMRLILISVMSGVLSVCVALEVGVVDEMLVEKSSALQTLIQSKSDKLQSKTKELEREIKQLQTLKEEFNKNAFLMDDKTRAQKQKDLLRRSQAWQTKIIAVEKERMLHNQVKQRYLEDACFKIAKQQKLNIIFSKMGNVLYADPELDVTARVIKQLPQKTSHINSETSQVSAV